MSCSLSAALTIRLSIIAAPSAPQFTTDCVRFFLPFDSPRGRASASGGVSSSCFTSLPSIRVTARFIRLGRARCGSGDAARLRRLMPDMSEGSASLRIEVSSALDARTDWPSAAHLDLRSSAGVHTASKAFMA